MSHSVSCLLLRWSGIWPTVRWRTVRLTNRPLTKRPYTILRGMSLLIWLCHTILRNLKKLWLPLLNVESNMVHIEVWD